MAYVPPAKRIAESLAAGAEHSKSPWAKSVKPQHKSVSISSLEDFPALGKNPSVVSHVANGGAGVGTSLTYAERMKKQLEEEKLAEETRILAEKKVAEEAEKQQYEYNKMRMNDLHKKLFRTNIATGMYDRTEHTEHTEHTEYHSKDTYTEDKFVYDDEAVLYNDDDRD